jgi:hypothetical protein
VLWGPGTGFGNVGDAVGLVGRRTLRLLIGIATGTGFGLEAKESATWVGQRK